MHLEVLSANTQADRHSGTVGEDGMAPGNACVAALPLELV